MKKFFQNNLVSALIIPIIIGIFIGVSGGFGTFEMPIVFRLFYWVIMVFLGCLIANLTGNILRKFIGPDNKFLFYIAMILIQTSLIGLLVWVTNTIIFNKIFSLQSFLIIIPSVFIINLFMIFIYTIIPKPPQQSHENMEINNDFRVKFLDRLPIKFRTSEIYAVKSEDHYLKIITNIGEAVILMRLYDAITELEGIEGTQTHRSWWVAKNAIINNITEDGKKYFIIKNNSKIPISRSYLKALKEQGWLNIAQN